jgi:hypothetical protein
VYSILLYMSSDRSHRVTFRVPRDLARALQALPNQTAFVEAAIRDALARTCPLCDGNGRVKSSALRVPNFGRARLPRLDAQAARRLREIVRLGKRVYATDLDLRHDTAGWRFRLARRDEVLLSGRIDKKSEGLTLATHN